MSLDEAQRLIERMDTDEAFRERVLTAPDTAGRLALARAEGFDCSVEEIESASLELGDAELDGVAGAGNYCGWGRECTQHFAM